MEKSTLSVKKFRITFLGLCAVWAAFQVLIINWLGFSWKISILDSFSTNPLLAASCLLLSNNLKFYIPEKVKHGYILALSLIMSALWLLACRWIISHTIVDEPEYALFFDRSMPIRFGIVFLLLTCMAMFSMMWYNLEEQKSAEQHNLETEKLSREAELFKLRQQLQPHFLFNSLNSISALILIDPEQARTMIQQLSDFLRNTLKKEDQQWVSLQEELQYLELYLAIEKVRFGHRLSTRITSDNICRQMQLPSMLLQPIVENAIKFGLYDTTGEITICIEAMVIDHQLTVRVQNPFDPENHNSSGGTGFGLSSVQRRLQLIFGRNDLLATSAESDQFITSVKIPQQQ